MKEKEGRRYKKWKKMGGEVRGKEGGNERAGWREQRAEAGLMRPAPAWHF
jgi:hypothetical protein